MRSDPTTYQIAFNPFNEVYLQQQNYDDFACLLEADTLLKSELQDDGQTWTEPAAMPAWAEITSGTYPDVSYRKFATPRFGFISTLIDEGFGLVTNTELVTVLPFSYPYQGHQYDNIVYSHIYTDSFRPANIYLGCSEYNTVVEEERRLFLYHIDP
jgi:hypothetical protein